MTDNDTAAKQAKVDVFNADNLPGAWVRYWTGTRQDPAKYGQTRSKAELLSGHTPVVWVTTHGACIALTHIDVIPGQPDGIEDDSHDLPKLAGAAERISDYITATGDGIYDVIDGHPLYARDIEALRRAADHVWAGEQLRDELAKVREQLTAANRRADGLAADLRSAQRGLTEYANQTGSGDDGGPLNYLIWSHHHQSWWGPNRSGYRRNPADAGRYTLAAAEAEMTRGCHCCQVPEVPVAAAKAIGKGDQAVRDAISQATDWAVKAGQANKAYEPVTVELPAEATR